MHHFIISDCVKIVCMLIAEVPKLVDKYMTGELPINHYITHQFQGVESINDAMHVLHDGKCLRAVVTY